MATDHTFHPLVREMLEGLVKTNHGLGLTMDQLRTWLGRFATDPQRGTLGVDLLLAARGFSKHADMAFAASELVGLAVALLGDRTVREHLSSDGREGLDAQRAGAIIAGAAAITRDLRSGIEPKPSGVGLRRPKR